MLTSLYTILDLLATTACAASSQYSAPNQLAGTWNLLHFNRTYPNGTTTLPLGPKPYGQLIFTPGLHYVEQFDSGDYGEHPWDPPPDAYQPGTDAQNAAALRYSNSGSGVYRVNEKGEFANLTTQGSLVPNRIGLHFEPPLLTLKTGNYGKELVERVTFAGDSLVYVWERVE